MWIRSMRKALNPYSGVPGCRQRARESNSNFTEGSWSYLKNHKSVYQARGHCSMGQWWKPTASGQSVDRLSLGRSVGPLRAGVGAGQQGLLAGLSWSIIKRDSPQDTGATGSEGKADDQTPNGMAFQPSQWWPNDTLLVQLAPYTESKEELRKGADHSRLVGDSFNKQENLHARLVLGAR